MYIEAKDLKKGDEILVPAGANLYNAIVMRDAVPHTKGSTNIKSIKLSICGEEIIVKRSTYNRKKIQYESKDYKISVYSTDLKKRKLIRSKDLNYKMIWLLNRENV